MDDSEPTDDAPLEIPKPSEYMRSNRPYLFSDSDAVSVSTLTQSQLEYHLETLTSRKEHFVFEDFCKRLAEVEICPNLKPQTGPVGGGDSKTDSSTYPVAPVLVDRCYWGSPNPPSMEAWAFAFSAKKVWRQKAKSDIKKIAELPTEFTTCLLYTSPSPRDLSTSRMPSSA